MRRKGRAIAATKLRTTQRAEARVPRGVGVGPGAMAARLVLAIHNHQPLGNLDEVFERATRVCYEPVVAALDRHPGVRAAMHFSGPLLDWLAAHRPNVLAGVRSL